MRRLADDSVLRLWIAMMEAARRRLPEVAAIDRELEGEPERRDPVPRDEIRALIERGAAIVIDVRPSEEYAHGHLPGAVSIPLDELPHRLIELPRGKRIVAYCRGVYCLSADEAIALLRERGFRAVRLDGGWPEWRSEGRPAATGP
jgi:rhodanese-related sulfurtransferase